MPTRLDLRLDRASRVPLYFQLSQQLETAIRDGRLQPGDRVETETELAERLGLGRPTVRQALQELVSKGLLMRRRGVGTQVVDAAVHRPLALTSLFDDLSAADHRPTTTVLDLRTVPADATVGSALRLEPGAEVEYLERLRFRRDEPLAVMRNWIPAGLIPLDRDQLEESGLYDLYRRSGVQPRVANQSIGARAATRSDARLLRVPTGAPLLTMTRTSFDETGRAIEYAQHCYRADAYSFDATLVGR
jgi:DNA-binding GntR family transcriptional regulator